jgi:alginate O-acetyltransferase complex protein AlgI
LQLIGQQGFRIMQITLPIGISFYTFQTISYTVDVYRGTAPPARRLSDFTCFVALFPHLIAGPIVRYNTIADQFGHRQHSYERFASGVAIFVLGFAKKILLANAMGRIADSVFAADTPDALTAWWGLLAYAGQIYFDFSGYSDIAVGLGRMVGFEIPRNFNSPYLSRSLTEFWQRWHMSLSSFLRDYLYYPLGGNRHGARRSMLNLWLVMLIGGLWHGASWKFVLWGAYHGLWLALERGFAKRDGFWSFLPRPMQMLVTFAIVLLSWVPFRAVNWAATVAYLRALFGFGAALPHGQLIRGEVFSLHHVVMMGVCIFVVTRKTQAWDLARNVSWPKLAWLVPLFGLGLAAMYTQSFNPFLYFQF